MSEEQSFIISFDDFDVELIGLTSADRDGEAFSLKVSEFFARQFAGFGGRAMVIVDDQARQIEVRWTKGQEWQDPKDKVLSHLNRGQLADAIPMIWTLIQADPGDLDNYYNLGAVYSELQHLDRAVELLRHVVEQDPKHVPAFVALGKAEMRKGNLHLSRDALEKAVQLAPENLQALRSLGNCLLKLSEPHQALPILQRCVEHHPNDIQSLVWLGEAYEAIGDSEEADECYLQAIMVGGPQDLVTAAKERRTAIAGKRLKRDADFRGDSMMYMVGALEKFANMSTQQTRDLGYEIAILGMNGLDINDPSPKYSLKSWPGNYSGLHLLSVMYAAFQQFAPHEDVGIDLSKEYEAAKEMLGGA